VANPKRKTSKAKKKRRRAYWMGGLKITLVHCPQCRSLISPHTVCPYCGFYKDRKIIKTRQEKLEEKIRKSA